MDGVFRFCRAFLQDGKRHDAGGKMQDELQEIRLAIHKAIYRLYKMHKRGNGALCKTVDSSGKARIMRLVRKKCAAAKMQREIQNGGNENAECSCCLQRRLFCRYGRDDRARNEELKNREIPPDESGGIFALKSGFAARYRWKTRLRPDRLRRRCGTGEILRAGKAFRSAAASFPGGAA